MKFEKIPIQVEDDNVVIDKEWFVELMKKVRSDLFDFYSPMKPGEPTTLWPISSIDVMLDVLRTAEKDAPTKDD